VAADDFQSCSQAIGYRTDKHRKLRFFNAQTPLWPKTAEIDDAVRPQKALEQKQKTFARHTFQWAAFPAIFATRPDLRSNMTVQV